MSINNEVGVMLKKNSLYLECSAFFVKISLLPIHLNTNLISYNGNG